MAKFTLQEVAADYRVSEDTILKAVKNGDLEGLKLVPAGALQPNN